MAEPNQEAKSSATGQEDSFLEHGEESPYPKLSIVLIFQVRIAKGK